MYFVVLFQSICDTFNVKQEPFKFGFEWRIETNKPIKTLIFYDFNGPLSKVVKLLYIARKINETEDYHLP